ncbi:hypothetical protein G6F35_018378 [Rhizopus arrhizus]|nr:hypothetical protein G6F35_018378 [Rhizopus arrhizus]
MALAIMEQALLLIGQAGDQVELLAAHTDQRRTALATVIAAAGQGAAVVDVGVEQERTGLAGRAAGDDVDDAAGATDALQRVGTMDDLDAFDHRRVDGVRVTRAIAQRRRLRYAIDHVQDAAATHRLKC